MQLHNCYHFLTNWMSAFPNRGIYHTGMVFCRYLRNNTQIWECVILSKSLFVQIYLCPVRHWPGQGGHQAPPPGHQPLYHDLHHQPPVHVDGKWMKYLMLTHINQFSFKVRYLWSGIIGKVKFLPSFTNFLRENVPGFNQRSILHW